ncbi:MAG: hypothetical protein SGILL_007825 [Bacillariaceae sp.]
MFQRLIKRFKRHHTPPASPSGATHKKDVEAVNEKKISPQRREKRTKDSSDDVAAADNQSVASDSSHSSSYSDYDYLETSGGGNPHHQRANSHDFSNDDGSVSSSDDDSSYSDYDDYQFLTAVSAAAAAKRKSQESQKASLSPKAKTDDSQPPAVITTIAAADDDAATKDSSVSATAAPTAKSDDNSAITPVELESLARTHFPDFFSDSEAGVPGAILSDGTDSSSDEEEDAAAVQRRTEKYRTKEDEDVAVFMNLAKRMSLKSLLHLLKGHVQSQRDQYSTEYMKHYNDTLKHCKSFSSSGDLSSSSLSSILSTDDDHLDDVKAEPTSIIAKKSPEKADSTERQAGSPDSTPKRHHHHRHHKKKKASLVKKKCFRWAEVTNEKVRTVVHEIESVKTCADLWWQPQEMHNIRADLIETVKFYRKRRPSYIQSVEIVARHAGELATANPSASSPPRVSPATPTTNKDAVAAGFSHQQQILEDHMKSLMGAEHSYARGLETHIVKMLSDHRKSTVSAVIEEQRECKLCNDDYDTTTHCLREQSIAYSSMSTKFSFAMARCDQIDALKASMSEWKQG